MPFYSFTNPIIRGISLYLSAQLYTNAFSNMKNRAKFFFFCCFCLLSLTGRGEVFRGVTIADGLSSLLVNSLYKDSNGFIWIGTDLSLDRFDGVAFKQYAFDHTDVKRRRVHVTFETNDGTLWVGNDLGLWRLNREEDRLERVLPDTIDVPVRTLASDLNGTLYIGTDKGLYMYKEKALTHWMPDSNLLSEGNCIIEMTPESGGRKWWLATSKGLFLFSPSERKSECFLYEGKEAGLNQFTGLTRINERLYLGTANAGVVCFDTKRHSFSRFASLGCDIISDVSSDGKDQIYVATDGNGVHFLSHATQKVVKSYTYDPRNASSIRSNSVYSLLVDKEHIVWIGYYQAGFDYTLYQSQLFKTYAFPPYFDSHELPVRCFCLFDQKKLIGTREGMFYIDEEQHLVKRFDKNDLGSNLILSICSYDEFFFIGTYGGGLSLLDAKTLSIRRPFSERVFQRGHVFHFAEDRSGNLWMATSEGVYCYQKEKKTMIAYTSANSQMPAGNVYYLYFDSTGKGWVATESGLCIVDPQSGTVRTDVFPNGFFNKEIIKVIKEDHQQQILFFPDQGQLLFSDPMMTRFGLYEPTKQFQNTTFLSMESDQQNRFWFGSKGGMIAVDTTGTEFRTFSFADGLPGSVFNSDASCKDENGVLWFGNDKGLLSVDPAKMSADEKAPYPIVITEIQVNGNPLDEKQLHKIRQNEVLELNKEKNNLLIRFNDFSYSMVSATRFECRLDGVHDKWVALSGRNEIYYHDLPSGTCTFRVRLQGKPASEKCLQVEIDYLSAASRTWLLSVIFFLIVSLTMTFFFRKRKREKVAASTERSLPTSEEEPKQDEKYKHARLGEEERTAICDKLSFCMQEQKLYLNKELKISELAQAVGCSSHALSFVFSQYLNQSYYDYINAYRVEEFKRLATNPEYARYTLSSLAEKAGFSSRASFFRSFKKVTGITPNEYMQSL